jgi:predicted TPR repeat methyltransferase
MDKSKMAAAVFDKWANEYQAKFMNVDMYASSFDLFCQNITQQHATILELASGPGNITHYLLQKRPDFNILSTDLSPNMIALGQANNPNATFQLLDCREILSLNKKFDGIMCGFCLPYLSKEEAIQLIADSANLLNANGLLYISTMEDDYNKSGFEKGSKGDEIFMHYHQADYLTEALQENGLTILHTERKSSVATNGKETMDLILIAQKMKT